MPILIKQEPKLAPPPPSTDPYASSSSSVSSFSSPSSAPPLTSSQPIKSEPMSQEMRTCCLCDKTLEGAPSASALDEMYTEHLMGHLEDSSYDSSCPKCPMKFDQKPAMAEHVLKTHGQLKKPKCSYCLREFWMRRSLNKHIAETHDDDCITLD